MTELPVARGLLICERVEHDPRTRRLTLVNRTTVGRFPRFPTKPITFYLFASLADGLGRIPIRVEVEHLESETVVLRHEEAVEFADRLREVPYLLAVRNHSYPAPGTYSFTLFAGGEPLASQVLRLTTRSPGSGGPT